jgi:hypothetical protein
MVDVVDDIVHNSHAEIGNRTVLLDDTRRAAHQAPMQRINRPVLVLGDQIASPCLSRRVKGSGAQLQTGRPVFAPVPVSAQVSTPERSQVEELLA